MNDSETNKRMTYAQAGVDIDAGDAFVEAIVDDAAATARPGVLGALGGFGALFDPKATGYRDPIMVAATDGVGTKLLGGIESGLLDDLGQDLVAMCVNDLVCQGAEPLFFLDYFATGKLDPSVAARVVGGIARACKACNCALIGGETAEMPQMYSHGHFDLAGFAVGMVERDAILPRLDAIKPGDKLVGWPSAGVHSNGFSLVRRILADQSLGWDDIAPWIDGTDGTDGTNQRDGADGASQTTVAQDLMRPTRLYVHDALALRGTAKAFAHITGGGLVGNVPRVLPQGVRAVVSESTWQRPAFFGWVIGQDLVEAAEAYRAFNMGIGLVAVLDANASVPPGAAEIGVIERREPDQEACQILP